MVTFSKTGYKRKKKLMKRIFTVSLIITLAVLSTQCSSNEPYEGYGGPIGQKHQQDEQASLNDSVQIYLDLAFDIANLDQDTVGDYGTALTYYNLALEIEPQNVEALRKSAYVYSLVGDFESGMNRIDQAISAEPGNLGLYFEKVDIFWHLGDKQGMLDVYNKVLEIDPGNEKALHDMGKIENYLK